MSFDRNNVIILAIETSGSTCSTALFKDGIIAGEYSIFNRNIHDKLLAEFIRRLLGDTGTSMNEIDAVALSEGPGSFTGIRIGASVAKALCFENKPKLISIPTLKAIAFSVLSLVMKTESKQITAVVPSHKDFVYHQSFNTNLKEQSDAKLSTIEELMEDISPSDFICGTTDDFHEKNSLKR